MDGKRHGRPGHPTVARSRVPGAGTEEKKKKELRKGLTGVYRQSRVRTTGETEGRILCPSSPVPRLLFLNHRFDPLAPPPPARWSCPEPSGFRRNESLGVGPR